MKINEEVIKREHIPDLNISFTNKSSIIPKKNIAKQTLKQAVNNYEKDFIYNVYKNNDFNKTKTAQVLDISIRSLYYKFDKLKIE